MEPRNPSGEGIVRKLTDLLDIVRGRKTAALQPVPVRVPPPVIITRPR
jgi:hypothetical protein